MKLINKMLFSWVFLASLIGCSGYQSSSQNHTNEETAEVEKQKGAHVFSRIDTTDFQFIRKNNVNWVTLVSWGFQKDFDSPEVSHGADDSTRVAEYNAYWVNQIKRTKVAGFKVFFKPHLWIHEPRDGAWRSDIIHQKESDWEEWKTTYSEFIIRYAKVAEEAEAEMFCIGVELTRLALEKPDYWKELISEVRKVYSGQLTYGANWFEEYENITFWKELDYIGVQAYFPLTENENPSVEELNKGWEVYLPKLDSISNRNQRPIIFTELGYKSTSNSAITPWEWAEKPESSGNSYSAETQANCYHAFFESVWPQDWFMGVHLWQFRDDYKLNLRGEDLDFTPQGKPAEKVIEEGFK